MFTSSCSALVRQKSDFPNYFVGNRIANILKLLPSHAWKHIPSRENPVDIASRSLLPEDLVQCDLWWYGPHRLHNTPNTCPEQPLHIQSQDNMEWGISQIPTAQVQSNISLLTPHSSFKKMVTITAWMRRFIENLRSQLNKSLICVSSFSHLNNSRQLKCFRFSLPSRDALLI